jgi:protein-disulfide isomerase
MHDMILANPKDLETATLRGYAKKLKLDMKKFDKLIADSKAIDNLLKEDLALAKKCKVRGTPTVLINGLKLQSRSISSYQKRIEQILGQAKAVKADSITP